MMSAGGVSEHTLGSLSIRGTLKVAVDPMPREKRTALFSAGMARGRMSMDCIVMVWRTDVDGLCEAIPSCPDAARDVVWGSEAREGREGKSRGEKQLRGEAPMQPPIDDIKYEDERE